MSFNQEPIEKFCGLPCILQGYRQTDLKKKKKALQNWKIIPMLYRLQTTYRS